MDVLRAPGACRKRSPRATGRRLPSWKTLTIPGAIGVDGLIATLAVESSTDSDVFFAYLDQVLCPRLKPSQVVVMDNLSTRERIAVNVHRHRNGRVAHQAISSHPLTIFTPSRESARANLEVFKYGVIHISH